MPPPKSELAVELGRRARAARNRHGWAIRALGKKAGYSTPMLTAIENGWRSPSLEKIGELADALNVTVDHLLGRDGRRP